MRGNAAKVLTVEDDPIVRADLRATLEEAGFEVCPDARDGSEAVELARDHLPDIVLMDLGLPGLNGVDATRLILDEQRVPVVLLTGQRREVIDHAIAAGAVAHVPKPFTSAALIGTLRGVLEFRHAARVADPHRVERLTEPVSEIPAPPRARYRWEYTYDTPVALSAWIRMGLGR